MVFINDCKMFNFYLFIKAPLLWGSYFNVLSVLEHNILEGNKNWKNFTSLSSWIFWKFSPMGLHKSKKQEAILHIKTNYCLAVCDFVWSDFALLLIQNYIDFILQATIYWCRKTNAYMAYEQYCLQLNLI